MSKRRTQSVVTALLGLLALAGALVAVLIPFPGGKAPTARLEQVPFAVLPGWAEDDPGAIAPSLDRQCGRWKWRKGDLATAMQAICAAREATPVDSAFIARHFDLYAVRLPDGDENGADKGLLTGYFEPTYSGSLERTDTFQVPLLARPDDLVEVDLGRFRDDLRGERIAGRVQDGRLVPYADRRRIRLATPGHHGEPILWLADPVDLFFLQIQGSGRIVLSDGTVAHVGYAAQNGHPYRAIGRDLIASGAIPREQMSMQAIRDWLTANPGQADALMDINASYVFFQQRTDISGAVGAAGTELTPGRSIAVDRRIWPLGVPMFVSAPPQGSDPGISRLVLAEDTGGAIRGPVRADLFLGAGDEAARLAGSMNRDLRLWVLLPKGVEPAAAGIPLQVRSSTK